MAAYPKGKTTERGYGWRWQKARIPFLNANALCAMCGQQGRDTPATIVDHKIPHKGDDNLFWDQANWQALCKPCHDAKTIIEDGGLHSGAMTHPEWLPLPACPVILVTGPPGAGKSTYCKAHAGEYDTIIDLDQCFADVCGTYGHDADRQYLKQAIRLRNHYLAGLSTQRTAQAFFIVSAPAKNECDWWVSKLNAHHVLIDPGKAVCEQRTQGQRKRAVGEWYRKARNNDWIHPASMREFDEFGWPIGR